MAKEEHSVRHTADEIDEPMAHSEAVWDCVDLGIGMPPDPTKVDLTLEVDADVLEWFTMLETDLDARVNEVLRDYIDSQRDNEDS